MSLSKLESFPNELLCDIIEKYINGVDLLVAFNHQLNRRFNALIAQSQRLRFNFMQCHKNEFRVCMGLLPAYIDNIEELVVSESYTPGQVHAFLSFFPSFASFKYLRRLYFHFNGKTTDWEMIEGALTSLGSTTIDTLLIKATNIKDTYSLNRIIRNLFHLKSLKRLSLTGHFIDISWDDLANISSNIEYLTISGTGCKFEHLQYIFQCARRLKYLKIPLDISRSVTEYQTKKDRKNNIVPMSTELHTLILSFKPRDPTLDDLSQYFNTMPVLNRLEIRAHRELFDADAWEMLLKRSLPLLNHFSLQATTSNFTTVNFHDVLATFQGLFWKSKKNFNVLITEHKPLKFNRHDIHGMHDTAEYEFDLPVTRWWTAPDRTANDNFIITNQITSLCLCDLSDASSRSHACDNVKYLVVDYIDGPLLAWVAKFLNCSQIMELVITDAFKKTKALPSLLAHVTNMNSLRINFDLLIATQDAFVRKDGRVKHLDISSVQHAFNEEDIIVIAQLFPYLECIKINTRSLYNVPLLKTYLPYLRTLIFEIVADLSYFFDDDYIRKDRRHEVQLKSNFFFQLDVNSITVWIDQATLEDPYWQTYAIKPSQSTATSTTMAAAISPVTSENTNNKKMFPFSYLRKLFK